MRGLGLVLVVAGCDAVFGIGPPPPEDRSICSTASTMADDFDDGLLLPWWRGSDTAPVTEEKDGVLALRPVDSSYTEIRGTAFLDLRDDRFSVEVIAPPTLGDFSAIELALLTHEWTPNGGNALTIRREGRMLRVGRYEGNTFFPIRDVPYDRIAHRFWQIANPGTVTTWSTSSDGQEFTTLAQAELPWLGFVQPVLGAARGNGEPAFVAQFDRLNGGGVAPDKPCFASSLQDDFAGTAIDALRWWPDPNRCTLTQDDALVVTSSMTPEFNDCHLFARTIYDLLASSIAVEVIPSSPLDADFGVTLSIDLPDERRARLEQTRSSLTATFDGVTAAMVPYDPARHRWWRLRGERAGAVDQLLWETSADGIHFEILGLQAGIPDLGQVGVRLGGTGIPSGVTTARFDNLNLPP